MFHLRIQFDPGLNPGNARGTSIIFMGTPEFAVPSLEALLQAEYNIVAVVTAPDKPAGRGMKINESAIKKYSLEKGLKILQPEKLKNPDFVGQLKLLKADLQVVVAFRMLPEIVWSMPRLGTINLHGSLLPQYRGAAPINWAIINGEKETGVTTFKLQQEIDTGNILLQESFPIGENETAGEVHDRMKIIGAQLLVKTVKGLIDGSLKEKAQTTLDNGTVLKHAPKIFTDTCRIDWNKSVDEIHNLIRGLSPFPGAFTYFEGKQMKIFRSKKEFSITSEAPGNFQTDKKNFLKVTANNGYIHIEEMQLEGKKKMMINDFLRGYR
ncbi:MAG TPA: methionyl-tRNA formyltransferase [Puia sp.]|nr:methionyl-tRNA formyltransferase [Puia sp.]